MMRRLASIALLAACIHKPVDVVAQIGIMPAKPGDDVDLYFGTVPRPGQLSETVPGISIDQVQAYAVDKIGPHTVKDVPADLHARHFGTAADPQYGIAVEDNATYAAATAIDLSGASVPPYVLKLAPVGQASGIAATAWGPLDQTQKECAYYSGPDSNGKLLEAAIIVDADTATTGTPFVDSRLRRVDRDYSASKCKPDVYDSMGQASDNSTCVATYPADADCFVVGQPSTTAHRRRPGARCLRPHRTSRSGACRPAIARARTTRYASLADIAAMPSSEYGAIGCDLQVTEDAGQPCEQMIIASGSSDSGAVRGGATTIDVEIGVAGPPYAMNATIPTRPRPSPSSRNRDRCADRARACRGLVAVHRKPDGPVTLMLTLTPQGSGRGVVLPVSFAITSVPNSTLCVTSMDQCTVTVPTSMSDPGLTTCLTP